MDFILDTGVRSVGDCVLAHSRRLAEGIESQGLELARSWRAETASGILAFRSPDEPPERIVARLRAANIVAAVRQGWVRFAPHFYQTGDEMNNVLTYLSQ